MASICRLCASLKKIENFVTLRDPELNLCEKLEKCCDLRVDENDNLPQNVCFECVQSLEESWKFFVRVQDAQESLMNVFGRQENKSLDEHNTKIIAKLTSAVTTNVTICSNSDPKLQSSSSLLQDHTKTDNEPDEEMTEVHVELENDEDDGVRTEEFIVGDVITDDERNIDRQGFITEFNQNEKGDENVIDAMYELRDFNAEEEGEENEQNDNENDEGIDYEAIDDENIDEDDGNDNNVILLNEGNNETWNDYPWKCIKCNLFVASITNLKVHTTQVHGKNSIIEYFCVDCMKTFSKYYTFMNHVKLRHRKYLQNCCDLCCEILKTSQELANHRSTVHANDENLVLCSTCGKAFKNMISLQIHSNCHKPYEMKYKYKCELCDKKFGSKPNLRAHQKIHIGLKEFVCDQCGKGFVQKANLEEHLLTHKDDCPYECEECHKKFKTPARLTKHKTVHTDVKPYECQTCGRLFRERDTLKVHSRIHTGAMPFECEYCGKRFRFKSILTTHRHQHTGVRPYSCIECNHHFTNWPNYNKHMKRRHGIDTSSSARKSQNGTTSTMSTTTK